MPHSFGVCRKKSERIIFVFQISMEFRTEQVEWNQLKSSECSIVLQMCLPLKWRCSSWLKWSKAFQSASHQLCLMFTRRCFHAIHKRLICFIALLRCESISRQLICLYLRAIPSFCTRGRMHNLCGRVNAQPIGIRCVHGQKRQVQALSWTELNKRECLHINFRQVFVSHSLCLSSYCLANQLK